MRKSVVTILIGLMLFGICGSSWAGVTATDVVCTGCVNDTDIAAAAVTNAKIGDGAVTETKILDGSITNTKIADGAVTDAKITGPISASKIEKPANVIVVATSGGDFTTIQAAIDSINPTVDNPYVIKVMPGTYTESVTMKSYVHLQGAGRDVTKVTFGEGPWYVIKCENVVNVAISGFTIDGYWGIYNNNSSPTISENRFKDTYSGTEGIVNSNSSPAITNNSFEMSKTNSRGIRNSGTSSPVIMDNQFIGSGTSGDAIISWNVNQESSPFITNNVVKGWTEGIRIDAGNAIVNDNLIEGNGTGIVTTGSPVIIKNNNIKGSISDGILLYYPATATVDGNVITGNGRYGVNGGFGGSTMILHNKIMANSVSDLTIGGGQHISFNVYDTITGSGGVGNYNLKSDGTPASLP